jgi:hypothetical protein
MMTIFNNAALRVRWAIFALAAHFTDPVPPPEMNFILPAIESRTDVESWATVALTPGPNVDVAKASFVASAIHYKSRSNKLHEKLLIVVHTPHGPAGTTTYLVTDRGPGRDEETRNVSADSSANLLLTSKDVWANDRIRVPGTTDSHSLESYKKFLKKNQYDALCTVTLSLPMSVAQLAVLLRAVYRHSVQYNLRKYQCYWYAYTVWEILRREYGGQVSQNKFEDRRGKYMGVKIMREDSVEAITEAYKKEWKAFCDEENRTRQQWEDLIRQVSRSIALVLGPR